MRAAIGLSVTAVDGDCGGPHIIYYGVSQSLPQNVQIHIRCMLGASGSVTVAVSVVVVVTYRPNKIPECVYN